MAGVRRRRPGWPSRDWRSSAGARPGRRTPRPSGWRPRAGPGRGDPPRRSRTPGSSRPRSRRRASGLAGFDRPDDRKILIGWADEVAAGAPAGPGQRRRPGGRGRDAGGLGHRRDRGHRLDRRGPHAGRAHRACRRLGAPDRRRGERLCCRPGRPPPGRPPRRRPRSPPAGPAGPDVTAHRPTLPGAGRGRAVADRVGALRARIQPGPSRLAGPGGPGGLRRSLPKTRCGCWHPPVPRWPRSSPPSPDRSAGRPEMLPLAAAGSFMLSATAVRQAMIDGLAGRGFRPALTPSRSPSAVRSSSPSER